MKKILTASATALLSLSLCACGTIVHGTKQLQTFASSPSSAHIKVDGKSYGKTPVSVDLKRSHEHKIDIRLPGYKPASFKLTKHISGWFFGNIIFGGVIGIVVDLADGAMYQLKPEQLNNGQMVEGKKDTITIILKKKGVKTANMVKIGQLKAS